MEAVYLYLLLTYTFENIANVIDRFTEVIGLRRFAICLFDCGAPVGPPRRSASRSLHRNHLAERQAYEEGLSDGLESHSGLLARTVAGQPRGAPQLPRVRHDALAVHARCA
jgi:hypothetical protein